MTAAQRAWAALSLVASLAAATWLWNERTQLLAFPDILSAYSAKEYCSCRYVLQNSVGYCQSYIKQYLPLSSLSEDPGQRRVLASGLGRSNTAAWVGPRQGCRLIPGSDG
ncbi:amidase [Pseudomonas putida]|nr:amidase [Pseudomonas putida]